MHSLRTHQGRRFQNIKYDELSLSYKLAHLHMHLFQFERRWMDTWSRNWCQIFPVHLDILWIFYNMLDISNDKP